MDNSKIVLTKCPYCGSENINIMNDLDKGTQYGLVNLEHATDGLNINIDRVLPVNVFCCRDCSFVFLNNGKFKK